MSKTVGQVTIQTAFGDAVIDDNTYDVAAATVAGRFRKRASLALAALMTEQVNKLINGIDVEVLRAENTDGASEWSAEAHGWSDWTDAAERLAGEWQAEQKASQ